MSYRCYRNGRLYIEVMIIFLLLSAKIVLTQRGLKFILDVRKQSILFLLLMFTDMFSLIVLTLG